MSLKVDSIRDEPLDNKENNAQNNLLLYNSHNNKFQGQNDKLYQSLFNDKNNSNRPIYLINNINNYSSSTIVNNREGSLDKNFHSNKKNQTMNINDTLRANRNLSSGVLKPSRRNPRFDRVLKKGKKIKNIDINRDYDEEPEDDVSSKMSSNSNMFKNKLASSLNKNGLDKSDIKNKTDIKPLNNNADEKSNNSKNVNNNKNQESTLKKSKTQFSVSKQKELNFSSIAIKPQQNNILPKENGIYNLSLGTIPEETTPPIITQETSNITSNLNELSDYNKIETLPQPQDIIDQEVIFSSSYGKGFKFCSQYSKPGKNLNGLEKTDQDTPLIYLNVGGIEGFNIFGVLDGHGAHGHLISQFCKNYFVNKMKTYVDNLVYITQYITAEDIYINLKNSNYSYIIDLFMNADNELKTQANFDYVSSGTTCNLIFQINNHLIDFNVGDSRSILIEDSVEYNADIIQPLSIDHKPDIPEELQRIQSCGGTVQRIRDVFGNELGPMRVFKVGCGFPGLAMSRSLGDLQAKECGVISIPQIIEYEVNLNTKYFVVCSDGIWEFMSNEQVKDIGNNFYRIKNAAGFCTELVNTSVNIWGTKELIRDDITVVAVFF